MHARSLGAALLALAVTTLSAIAREVTAAEEWLFDTINGLPDILEWPLWVVIGRREPSRPWPCWPSSFGAGCGRGSTWWWLERSPGYAPKVIKGLLERGRPASFLDDVNLRGSLGADNMDGLGFPSGHVAVAVALAAVVYPCLTPRWRVVTMVLTTTVALTRLYFGAHFPLDALGGAALGIAIGATVHLVMDRVTHHH